ncbi:MAG: MFS transporter [Alphaproteobacteria bacterium]
MVWVGAQSLICQYTQGKTSMLGRFSFCARIGTLSTPILIGAVWDWAGPWGAFVFGGVWAGMVCLALLAVPVIEDLPEAEAVKVPVSQSTLTPKISDYVQAFSLLAIPAIAFIFATTALRISSSGIQTSFYVVYLENIGLTGTYIGILISISEGIGCFGTLAAGPVERFIKPHWVMLLFVAMSLFFVTITPLLGGIMALLAFATAMRGFAQGLTQPVMFGILARAVSVKQQGISIGLRTTANRLASIFVPVIMGVVADAVGIEASFLIIGGSLIALCAVTALVVQRIPGLQT